MHKKLLKQINTDLNYFKKEYSEPNSGEYDSLEKRLNKVAKYIRKRRNEIITTSAYRRKHHVGYNTKYVNVGNKRFKV